MANDPGLELVHDILAEPRLKAFEPLGDELLLECSMPAADDKTRSYLLRMSADGAQHLTGVHPGRRRAAVVSDSEYLYVAEQRKDERAALVVCQAAGDETWNVFDPGQEHILGFVVAREVSELLVLVGDLGLRPERPPTPMSFRKLAPSRASMSEPRYRLARVPLRDSGMPPVFIELEAEIGLEYNGELAVAPDGRTLALGHMTLQSDGSARFGVSVLHFDAAGAIASSFVVDADCDLTRPMVGPDGSGIACRAESIATPDAPPRRGVAIVDSLLENPSCVVHWSDDYPWVEPAAWLDTGRLACIAPVRGDSMLLVCAATGGSFSAWSLLPGLVHALARSPHGWLAMLSDTQTPPRICMINDPGVAPELREIATPTSSLSIHGGIVRTDCEIGGQSWSSWICTPEGKDQGLPVVVLCHGGPLESWGVWSWRWNPWPFVQRGHVVLMVNPPVSLGYDSRGYTSGWGRWNTGIARIAAEQIQAALADIGRPHAQLAIMGSSFGGYLSLALGARLEPALVVAHAAFVDLATVADYSDIYWHWLREYGPPSDERRGYERESLDVTRMRQTRTLVSHGWSDPVVPASEAFRVARSLGREGRSCELWMLPDEAHNIERPRNVKRWWEWIFAELDSISGPGAGVAP